MINSFYSSHEKEILSGIKDFIKSCSIGLEKESLRMYRSNISTHPHPKSLGSPLFNKFITTDFSDAQLELVTPPLKKQESNLFLNDIHHFVSHHIQDEILWPMSIPPHIDSINDIPIAKYGTSNMAFFKEVYRKGLSHRYGRMMQAISGVHYNFSLPNEMWPNITNKPKSKSKIEPRSKSYFNMLRNIFRINWLILYLFGASPLISKCFISNNDNELKKLDKLTYYLPYATSLRMSKFGYSNSRRSNISVSMNSLEDYISDLIHARSTPSNEFSKIEYLIDGKLQQLSPNILQIDDEYYAIARAKSSLNSDSSTTSKLITSGVDFIELRSLDLNPFSPTGIDNETIMFLELLLIYCFVKQEKNFSDNEVEELIQNDSIVALRGREPNLKLSRNGKSIYLEEWANEIIDDLIPIASIIETDKSDYKDSIEKMRHNVKNSHNTLSGQLLEKILASKLSFLDFGTQIGESFRSQYMNIQKAENKRWKDLEDESKKSQHQKQNIESTETIAFDEFLSNYYK